MNHITWSVVLLLAVGSVQSAQQAGAQTTVDVDAVGLSFVPPDVTIEVGDSVHWTGLAGGFHTVAQADDAGSLTFNGSGFHSPAAASEFTHTFAAPGLYHYICEPHVAAGMRGTITVNVPVPIPTLSAWGATAMALILVVAGTTLVRRRQRS